MAEWQMFSSSYFFPLGSFIWIQLLKLKVMRSHNFYLMNLFLIWYKDPFKVVDMNLTTTKVGAPSPFSYHGNWNIRVYIAKHFTFL